MIRFFARASRPVALMVFFFFMIVASIPAESMAYVVGAGGAQSTRGADISTIQRALEEKAVGERLAAIGLTQSEIDERLASLSDEEVHAFASQIDNLYAGGNVGVVLIILAIIVLVVFALLGASGKKLVVQ